MLFGLILDLFIGKNSSEAYEKKWTSVDRHNDRQLSIKKLFSYSEEQKV